MHKGIRILFICLSALALMALPLLTLFAPAEEISLFENRRLAQAPTLTADTLFDGSWFSDSETWLQDHIAGRDALLRADAALTRASGVPFVNDILLSDGPLLPDTTGPDTADIPGDAAEMAARLAAVSRQVESYGGVFLFVGVPNQYSACRAEYPGYMDYVGQALDAAHDAFFAALDAAGVRYLDLGPTASPADYYRTDHHMTLPAAVSLCGKIYAALEEAGIELPETDLADYTYRTLPNPFYGSRSRRLYGLVPFDEKLTVFDRGPEVPFTRRDQGEAVPAALLDLPATDTEIVDYGVFMGGDMGETVLETNRPGLPSALLFGDSYTNALETVFYTAFDETRSLDLRYWAGPGLADYIEQFRPAVVVCLRDDANYLNRSGNGDFSAR